jgi:flagellar motor switch protein FliN/FliY
LIAELNDLSLSAVSEAMNQMMGSATTSMSSMFDQRIDIYPPNLAMVDFANDSEIGFILDEDYENLVQISFKMVIENLLDSEIMQLIPVAYAREMVSTLMKNIPGQEPNEDHSEPAPQKDDFITDELSMSWEETESQIDWGPEPVDFTVPPSPTTNPSAATTDNRSGIKKGQVAVRPVQFAGLDEPATQKEVRNIDIILDVPLDVAVELGKTKKSIKEILELGPGSIIQLDRLAGEPVDLLVNGKLIAKGEVVVIDENYGIRISAIVSPMDRMTKLQ